MLTIIQRCSQPVSRGRRIAPESGGKIPNFIPNISRYPRNALNVLNAKPYEYGVL
jgi:hypothetical protein